MIIEDKYYEYLLDYDADVQAALDSYETEYNDAKAAYDAQRDPFIEYYDNAVANRADYCASASQPIGSTFEVPI